MVDRLTLLLFGSAVDSHSFRNRHSSVVRRNALWGLGTVLVFTIAYYREFFATQSESISGSCRRIDSAGSLIQSVN